MAIQRSVNSQPQVSQAAFPLEQAIIVGHIFSVHYNPHVYPMNRAFIDGMISEDLMKEEHRLWYERVMEDSGSPEKEADRNA